jgi:hypothetical protein
MTDALLKHMAEIISPAIKPDCDATALAAALLDAVRAADKAAWVEHIDQVSADFRKDAEAGLDPTRQY